MSAPIHVSKADFEKSVLAADLLLVAKVNVDAEVELARAYDIRSIPTLLFVRSGEVVDRFVGVLPEPQLIERFEALIREGAAE